MGVRRYLTGHETFVFLYLRANDRHMGRGQACFGECSQWGYWARLRSAEGCNAAPGVRISHSPLGFPRRCIDNIPAVSGY